MKLITKMPDMQDEAFNAFIGGEAKAKSEKKEEIFTWQSNLRWTKEEEDLVKEGCALCLDKMPMYEYQKRAVIEKAKADIEKRKQVDAMIASIKK